MADSNVNINVTANTGQATSAMEKLSSSMSKISDSIDGTAKKMYNAGHTIQEFGQNIASIGQKATLGISLPLAAISKTLIETGAEMTAMHQTFKTVFGSLTKEAQAWANNLGKSVGLSGGVIDKTNLQFRKMAGAFGLTGQSALDFSEKWTKLTLDVSAFNDVDITDSTERMMSGMRGEADAVEKLGIFMGNAQLQQEMMREGLKGQYSDLDSVTKMNVLYNLAMKQTAQANGQAAREATSYQNSMANLKQAYAEFAEKFYQAVQPALLDFLKQLTDMLKKLQKLSPEQIKFYANLMKWAIILPLILMYVGNTIAAIGRLLKVASGLLKVIKWFADWESIALRLMYVWDGIVAVWETMVTVATTIGSGIMSVFSVVAEFLASVGGVIEAVGGVIMTLLEAIAAAVGLSVGVVVAIIVAIIAAVVLIIVYWDEIKAATISAWNYIVQFFIGVWGSISSIFATYVTPLVAVVASAFTAIYDVILAVINGIMVVFNAFAAFNTYLWAGIILPILQLVGGLFQAVGQLIAWAIQQVIGAAIDWLAQRWSDFYNGVLQPIAQLIILAVNTVGQAFVTLWNAYVAPAIAGIQACWSALCMAIQAFFNAYVVPTIAAFMAGWNAVVAGFNTVMNALKSAWSSFCSYLMGLWNAYGAPAINAIKDVANSAVAVWNSAWESAKGLFNSFIDGVKSAWDSLKSVFKLPHVSISGSWDLTPPNISVPSIGVKWYKNGGVVDSPTLFGAGEAGAEAVVPLTNRKSMSLIGSALAASMPDNYSTGGSDTATQTLITGNNFYVRNDQDINRLAEKLNELQEQKKRGRGKI